MCAGDLFDRLDQAEKYREEQGTQQQPEAKRRRVLVADADGNDVGGDVRTRDVEPGQEDEDAEPVEDVEDEEEGFADDDDYAMVSLWANFGCQYASRLTGIFE